jgi:hypothetical protein
MLAWKKSTVREVRAFQAACAQCAVLLFYFEFRVNSHPGDGFIWSDQKHFQGRVPDSPTHGMRKVAFQPRTTGRNQIYMYSHVAVM